MMEGKIRTLHRVVAWLAEHRQILAVSVKKDALAIKLAMWQPRENVKPRPRIFSDADAIDVDGYLFDAWRLDRLSV
ncbi:hypothetical protein [Edwardsiella tarda]|uniref:hypothetical protein n=1 Tax=Edwardsiella tarda TaxID=636 RepID=UPI00063BDFD7|nr:hypothetical protein [Edwardsiella tarda]AKH89693.1 transcriptional regulator [Edwardsiella tarda]